MFSCVTAATIIDLANFAIGATGVNSIGPKLAVSYLTDLQYMVSLAATI